MISWWLLWFSWELLSRSYDDDDYRDAYHEKDDQDYCDDDIHDEYMKMMIIRKENVSNLCCKPPWQSFHTNLQRPACQIPQLANPLLLNEVGEPDQRPAHSTLQLPRSVVEPFQQIVLAVLAIWKFSFNWNISALCEYIDVFQSRRNACSRQNVQKPIPTLLLPRTQESWILWAHFDKHFAGYCGNIVTNIGYCGNIVSFTAKPIWANICWPPTRNYFPNSWHQTTWSVAFKILNSQLYCL